MAKRFKLAVPILEQAAEAHPDEPQVWINLGAAHLGNPVLASDEQQHKALDAFNRAISLDPYAHNVEYNIGLIHRDRGEVDLAIQAFERALRVNPNDHDARRLIEKLRATDR
jgi:tetratricopeptide (TPR) repeat protein